MPLIKTTDSDFGKLISKIKSGFLAIQYELKEMRAESKEEYGKVAVKINNLKHQQSAFVLPLVIGLLIGLAAMIAIPYILH